MGKTLGDNYLRGELENLVQKWQNMERENNEGLHKTWQKNNFEGFPGDYNKDPNGLKQREIEKIDIENLQSSIGHNIAFIEQGERNKNCYAYVILNTPDLKNLLTKESQALEYGGRLLSQLKRDNLLIEDKKGNIVLYFDDYSLKHSGIQKQGVILSKWGGGNVYRHGILEVPSRYGNPTCCSLTNNEEELKKFQSNFFSNEDNL